MLGDRVVERQLVGNSLYHRFNPPVPQTRDVAAVAKQQKGTVPLNDYRTEQSAPVNQLVLTGNRIVAKQLSRPYVHPVQLLFRRVPDRAFAAPAPAMGSLLEAPDNQLGSLLGAPDNQLGEVPGLQGQMNALSQAGVDDMMTNIDMGEVSNQMSDTILKTPARKVGPWGQVLGGGAGLLGKLAGGKLGEYGVGKLVDTLQPKTDPNLVSNVMGTNFDNFAPGGAGDSFNVPGGGGGLDVATGGGVPADGAEGGASVAGPGGIGAAGGIANALSGGDTGQGGGSGTPSSGNYLDVLAQLSQDYFGQTQGLRTGIIDRGEQFLAGDLDVTKSPLYASGKNAAEVQYGLARDATLANLPSGGGLQSALARGETDKARTMTDLSAQIGQDEYNKIFGLATSAPAVALGGLGTAAGQQANLSNVASQIGSQQAGRQMYKNLQEDQQKNQLYGDLGGGIGESFGDK